MLIDFRKLFPKYSIYPKGVLHIGANVGEEAPVYNELGIKKVIWIEGNPEIFDKLVVNISRYPGQIAYNYCIGESEGLETSLHISNNASQSSSILELGTHRQQHPGVHFTHDVPVTLRRIDSIFKELPGIDFLNIDLQGAELLALRGMGDLLRQFKWLYLEVNQKEVYKGCPNVLDLDIFLNGFGFMRVETKWCGDWGDGLYLRRQ